MDFGLSSVNSTDELRSVFVPNTRIRRTSDVSNWLLSGHDIIEATADRVIGTKAKNHCDFKSEFETRREKMVEQDFGCLNNSMSQPPLESNPLGTNMTNGTMSPIELIRDGTKTPEPTPLALPMDSLG